MKRYRVSCTHHATDLRAGKCARKRHHRAPERHGAVRQGCNRDTPTKLEKNRHRGRRKLQIANSKRQKNSKLYFSNPTAPQIVRRSNVARVSEKDPSA